MRNYKKKTERTITPQNVIKNAVNAVLLEAKSIRKTAKTLIFLKKVCPDTAKSNNIMVSKYQVT